MPDLLKMMLMINPINIAIRIRHLVYLSTHLRQTFNKEESIYMCLYISVWKNEWSNSLKTLYNNIGHFQFISDDFPQASCAYILCCKISGWFYFYFYLILFLLFQQSICPKACRKSCISQFLFFTFIFFSLIFSSFLKRWRATLT